MSQEKPKEQMQNLIRVANADLKTGSSLFVGLTKINGVSFMFANAICKVLDLKKSMKVSELDDATITRIEQVIENPLKFNFPNWLLNRRRDPETGEDMHISLSDVKFVKENDIKLMKKIKSYRGMRHQWGLPVRGQRTKSNFRRNKGKAMGVKRKK
ncbi:30S ribosomal protein S13 [Candidatus Woesearchaeota archaeon]|jgi:small subunit ribosomal protein S13|nr:30S ribosomal protein S13 [Candidatus Woesearchaeota archaeon]MBT4368777.1 30S ribosomal protein S13 [Candidatus Woesearchaeota archaeon]MBT4712066.1 30S ribosomal protein S13 [Candidatus Woesearchaeota archaeon]MBT6639186.1 30S ribosomal protein S13 [Candidatus Woesearchaeota archaeon]MBT7134386.1 30S ribosomal protein S13 [Candidatus Woesearchaeota archaeon]